MPFVRDKPLVKFASEMNFRIAIISACRLLLLFQPPNIKYGVISTSSLGEKVLSGNHGDPSRQASGSEQASPKSNPAEGIVPSEPQPVSRLDEGGCRKSRR